MKNSFLLLILCWIAMGSLSAQNCRSILNEAKASYSSKNLKQAFKKLQDTETCDYKNELLSERQSLQNAIFNAIDDQRIEAENNARIAKESAQKVVASEKATQEALRKVQTALDSLNFVLGNLDKANADKVRLILAEVARNQKELNFAAAVDKIKTAKILRALPDSVNLAYQKLSYALLSNARGDLERKDYQSALAKITSAGELNVQPDSVAAVTETLRLFLFENASQDILQTDYDAALGKINALTTLSVTLDTVLDLWFEVAFCYAETGRLDAAAGLIDTMAQLNSNNAVRGMIRELAGKKTLEKGQLLRQARQQLDPKRADAMIVRYLPPNFVAIMGGTFMAGPDAGKDSGSKNTCPLSVGPFKLAPRELTFYEYDLFCAATNRPKPSDNGWGRGSRPVVDVNWFDAVAYCNWRSRREELTEVYVIDMDAGAKVTCNWLARGYRLPTEAEWELAAGNGEAHTQFSWGNDLPTAQHGGNVADETIKPKFPDWKIFSGYSDGNAYTAPVGSFAPSALGLFDMTGNVLEWCWDGYDADYCRAAKNGKTNQKSRQETDQILRGGSWSSFPEDCYVGNRFHRNPTDHNFGIGFRLAKN